MENREGLFAFAKMSSEGALTRFVANLSLC